jgi:nicotinamidase/pyrazinamidase
MLFIKCAWRILMLVENHSCLIVVDVQIDFVSGSLAVPGASQVLPYINNYMDQFEDAGHPIVFTKDCHKPRHPSFKQQGGLWPPHCVINTIGYQLAPGLDWTMRKKSTTILKGFDEEAYSGFEGTSLDAFLKHQEIKNVYICGLATDYCVKATALDALKHGVKVFVLLNACAGVAPDTTALALQEMQDNGVHIV